MGRQLSVLICLEYCERGSLQDFARHLREHMEDQMVEADSPEAEVRRRLGDLHGDSRESSWSGGQTLEENTVAYLIRECLK